MSTDSTTIYPKLIALDVAETFLAEFPHSLAETPLVIETAMMVGQHLADLGKPGEWMHLDVERFYKQIGHLDENELIPMSLTLIGIYGWLGSIGILPTRRCKSVLQEIARVGPQVSYLLTLAKRGQRLLDTTEMAVADTVQLN